MTRVLFLAQRVTRSADEPTGASAHAELTLAALSRDFDVVPMFASRRAPPSSATWPRYTLREVLPAEIRGLRQDWRFVAEDRAHTRDALDVAAHARPDVVYARNEYFSVAGLRVARALGVPLVLEVNGLLDLDMRTFYRSFAEPLGRGLERLKYRRADTLVATSQTLELELIARGADPVRCYVVPNVASPELLLPARERPAAGDRIVVGWLGHGLAWHGLDLLAAAAEHVAEAVPATVFRIVGSGPAVDELRAYASRPSARARYEFAGTVPAAERPHELRGFDVGVVPENPHDRFPIKLVEMGAAGIPVAAPPVPCITDLLRPGVDFEPFRAGDPSDLAATLLRLIEEPARRLELGSALQARVRAKYTVDHTAALLRDIVEDTLSR